jgi:tellurite resistance protein
MSREQIFITLEIKVAVKVMHYYQDQQISDELNKIDKILEYIKNQPNLLEAHKEPTTANTQSI